MCVTVISYLLKKNIPVPMSLPKFGSLNAELCFAPLPKGQPGIAPTQELTEPWPVSSPDVSPNLYIYIPL
jgi:hypothetical protein